jgi:hypothetical protein
MMASLDELLTAFSESCATQFRFLVDDHKGVHRSGFSLFDGQPPTLQAGPVPASGLFCFIERFELPKVTLDVEFGDRESIVEAKLYYRGEPSVAPWEFADAGAVKDPGGLAGSMWVLDVTHMHEVIAAMAASLLESWSSSRIRKRPCLRGSRSGAVSGRKPTERSSAVERWREP